MLLLLLRAKELVVDALLFRPMRAAVIAMIAVVSIADDMLTYCTEETKTFCNMAQ